MSITVNFDRLSMDEYEIQHFGVSSTEVLQKLQNLLIHKIQINHEEMEQSTAKHLKLDDERIGILHEEINKLTRLYTEKMKEIIKINEDKVRQYFSIPKHILLKNDEICNNIDNINEEEILKEITTMEQELLQEKTLLALYNQELEDISQIEEHQQIYETIDQVSKLSKITENLNDLDMFQVECNKKVEKLQISDIPIKWRMDRHKFKFIATTKPKSLI